MNTGTSIATPDNTNLTHNSIFQWLDIKIYPSAKLSQNYHFLIDEEKDEMLFFFLFSFENKVGFFL